MRAYTSVQIGSAGSVARAINAAGQVVGTQDGHAYLWDSSDPNGIDLNTRLPGGSCWTLIDGWDINDAGQVVGCGSRYGQTHIFVLDPQGIADCNGHRALDACDIASGTSRDCNQNGFPDDCDIAHGLSADANGNGIPDECEGDMNCNRLADGLDVQGFVEALIAPAEYSIDHPGCSIFQGDMDNDGDVDLDDVPLFVTRLLQGR